jgi:hypothetical protein
MSPSRHLAAADAVAAALDDDATMRPCIDDG